MYSKGDIQFVTPPCDEFKELEMCWTEPPHVHAPLQDYRGGKEWQAGSVFLPHSYNEWVIGGAEEVRMMIADLQAALASMEGSKR